MKSSNLSGEEGLGLLKAVRYWQQLTEMKESGDYW